MPKSDQPPPPAAQTGAAETPAERRLAAILAADVEGYSRLMHEDEEATLATLTAHRALIDRIIVAGHGQVFGTAGDSVLAEFPSVVEAFNAAVAMQQALTRANEGLPEPRRMAFRVGINVGDVIVRGEDIFGDGVNVAARVEALGEAGGICVTRAARDHLRDRVEARFEDLGEHRVKNIARPLRVYRAVFDRNGSSALLAIGLEGEEPARPATGVDSEDETPDNDSVEIAFWQSVQASDDDTEYRIYLERYPDGAFAELAEARLRGASAVEDTEVELAFWETVRESDDPAMLTAYLQKYPRGEFRALAEIMLARLQKT